VNTEDVKADGPVSETPENLTSERSSPEAAADELAEAKAESARFKEQLLRTAADFDNFRKRSRREAADAERKGRDDLLKEMLPVFDNLERAASHARGSADSDSSGLLDGLTLVLRQFEDTLARLGVEKVPGMSAPFDPSVHEAIQHMETTEFPHGTVAAMVQAGYRQGDKLIRPALVVVAKAPAASAPEEGSTESA
jgi:molecular chaperone GrpE